MKVRFYEDKQGEHRWTLDGDNGEPLSVASEGYKRQDGALHCFELSWGGHVSLATGEALRLVTPTVIDPENLEAIIERAKVEIE